MLQISRIVARSLDLDHLDLFWEIADTDENPLGYDLFVLRSESPLGPWDMIAGPFQDQYWFRDTSPALLHKWRALYYKIRVVNKTTQETLESDATSQLAEPDLIALEIMRQEDVLFREHIGRRCWLFPVRSFGAKCLCVDKITGRRMRSNCLTCFDTGYLGGFLKPIELWAQFDPDAKNPQLTPQGEQQLRNSSARLISFPPIKPRDILIEAENRRWRVVTVAQTERLRAKVHQELTLHEIEKGDIEFKLPVALSDLANLSLAAERNYSNPHHTDNDPDLRTILSFYAPRGAVR